MVNFTKVLKGLVIALLASGSAHATNIIYDINIVSGQDSVIGSLTTDGVFGNINKADVLAFNITLSNGSKSYTLTNNDPNIYLQLNGIRVDATATKLSINSNPTDTQGSVFQVLHTSGDSASFAVRSAYIQAGFFPFMPAQQKNASSSIGANGFGSNGIAYGVDAIPFNDSSFTIGTVAASASAATPEPETYAMMLVGMTGIALRLRKSAKIPLAISMV